jgi:hypothetical protein
MILAYLGKNVKEYREKSLRYLNDMIIQCPTCGSSTTYHDSYDRHVHIGEIVEWLIFYRVKCVQCDKTHAIIPDFVSPRKHYSTCDIEFAINETEAGIPIEQVDTAASISTLRRWHNEFIEKVAQTIGALRGLLYRLYERTINELELKGLQEFAKLEKILARFPQINSSNLIIGETNIWLTNHIAGEYW